MQNVEKSIRFNRLLEIRDFVNLASKYSCDVKVKSHGYVVDGKSVLGILSLALWQPVIVSASGVDADDFISKLRCFEHH